MAKLVDCLLHFQLLDEASINAAIIAAENQKMALSTYLVKHKLIDSRDLLYYTSQYFALPVYDLQNYQYQPNMLIPHHLINRFRALPIALDENSLAICVADPTQDNTFTTINFHTGKKISVLLGDEKLIEKILSSHCRPNMLLSRFMAEEQTDYKIDSVEQTEEPIIDYVNQLISNAIEKNVSDIHIEPYAQLCRIRFRRDGLLYEVTNLTHPAATRIITRLKIMANLNIAERRLPQDGRIPWRDKENIDIRLNSIPTLHGEKIVLRLLNMRHLEIHLDALGLLPSQLLSLREAIQKPQGLILITGPTGSGKTVTLYSILRELNQAQKNISTVEDPIEIEMHGINQVNINPQIGLNFPTVLRMLLRQDPDILMIGEIRDLETANIALQAAQTGHLVLSTLHTNSPTETLQRLRSLGVTDHLLNDTSAFIVTQRLVRVLCLYCKQTNQAIGCTRCHEGYNGRTGIFAVTEDLRESAQYKINEGITTQHEINRVII